MVRRAMRAQNVDALLVTHLPDVRYLTGFTGSNAAVCVTASRAALFTDGRYTLQAREQVSTMRIVIAKKSALAEACVWLESTGVIGAAFDPEHTTVAQLAGMRKALTSKRRAFFQPLKSSIIATLRLVKDIDELRLLREAAHLGVRLFNGILPQLRAGATEIHIAAELEYAARRAGAEAMSFETIVASGPRSALPHGHATVARLPRRGFVTLDFGVILNGYCSDMTRTVHVGRASARERDAYAAVLAAQQAAVHSVRAGMTCGEVDEAARGVLRHAGLAQHFTHSTGHGVGIEIHEGPRIAAGQATQLVPGMVITIEPGIYIAGEFGIRIEDTVVVEQEGAEILTPAAKSYLEV